MDWESIEKACRTAMAPVYKLAIGQITEQALKGHSDVLIESASFDKIIPGFFEKDVYVDLFEEFCAQQKIEYIPSCKLKDESNICLSWKTTNIHVGNEKP